MRKVLVKSPSFPAVPVDALLPVATDALFAPLCGDTGHWRTGWYRPNLTTRDAIQEFERHSCPELFLLIGGRITLVLCHPPQGEKASFIEEIELLPGRPVLVEAPHAAYCPDGPRTGLALVVERDLFETVYRSAQEIAESSD